MLNSRSRPRFFSEKLTNLKLEKFINLGRKKPISFFDLLRMPRSNGASSPPALLFSFLDLDPIRILVRTTDPSFLGSVYIKKASVPV